MRTPVAQWRHCYRRRHLALSRGAGRGPRTRISNFVEIYVECPLEILVKRDVKGLYEKALRGEIAALHRHHGSL